MFIGLRDKGFSALLQVDPESVATQSEVDGIFRNLLQRINVTDMTEIEAYD